MNVWPIDSTSGRFRGGLRPSSITLGALSSPYGWRPCTYFASGAANVGIAVVAAGGTYTTLDGVTFTEHIATNPGALVWPDQATCAVFQQKLYQAVTGSTTVRERDFIGGAEGALTISGSGSVPTKCGIVLVHGGRLILMGDKDNPHVWYASAIGNARLWDYADVTSNGAFASTGSQSGIIGERIIAGFSHDDNFLLIFGTDTVFAVRGNPRAGRIEQLSHNVGALMQSAICQDDLGYTYFLSRQGLYQIAPGGSQPKLMSGAIPNELVNIRPEDGDKAALGYDHRWPGVHVFVNYNSGTDKSFFYSTETKGFFPQSFSSMPILAASFPKIKTDNNSSLVMFEGTNAKQFKRDPEGDEVAESRDSYIWIPIPPPSPGSEGIIQAITVALAKDSADVNWAIYVGDSAEQAFNSSAAYTGQAWVYSSTRYLQTWRHLRRRYAFAYLKVSDVSNNRWLIERLLAKLAPAGMLRVG